MPTILTDQIKIYNPFSDTNTYSLISLSHYDNECHMLIRYTRRLLRCGISVLRFFMGMLEPLYKWLYASVDIVIHHMDTSNWTITENDIHIYWIF